MVRHLIAENTEDRRWAALELHIVRYGGSGKGLGTVRLRSSTFNAVPFSGSYRTGTGRSTVQWDKYGMASVCQALILYRIMASTVLVQHDGTRRYGVMSSLCLPIAECRAVPCYGP